MKAITIFTTLDIYTSKFHIYFLQDIVQKYVVISSCRLQIFTENVKRAVT